MRATRLLLLAGGQSEEHPISILSARGVLAAAERCGMQVSLRIITRQGALLNADDSRAALARGEANDGGQTLLQLAEAVRDVDVVFPLLHGPLGEDGTVQGLLTLLGIPYVGSGVLASALCMDKPMAKEVLRANDIPQVAYRTVHRKAYATAPEAMLDAIIAAMPAPWFVKPANLGSSVGVNKARDKQGLASALKEALLHDRRAIVEAGVPNVRELEIAVLGNEDAEASVVGEITYKAEFYDYAAKYTEGCAQMIIPAKVPDSVAARMRTIALQAYALLDCAGLARVDFFYAEKEDKLLLNELNTLPGFTAFSMYPGLWQAAGVSYEQLLQRLVALALERAAADAAPPPVSRG